MNGDRIVTGAGGTTFVGHDATRLFAATVLRSALKLLAVGIKPSRGWTMTKALKAASQYTGRSYKRSEAKQAQADLTLWIETMKSALPVERRDEP